MTAEWAWQRGIEMDVLRAHAAVFKERHKPLVHGAFGLIKERDIADAIAAGGLAYKGTTAAPRAIALVHRLKAMGGVTDFAGRSMDIPTGDAKVSAFAALDAEAGAAVLQSLESRAPGRLWVEIFEEDDIARTAIEAVPALRYITTRIAAGSEVKGIYSNRPVLASALDPIETLSLKVVQRDYAAADERAAIMVEIDAYAEWEQHYSSYNKRQSWTAYALRGYDAEDPRFIVKPAEMAKGWKAEHPERMAARPEWTTACPKFPHLMRLVQRILGGRGADRVRLMKLAPNGELSRHADITDHDAGLGDGRLARLHLPLRTSDAVVFHGWDKRGTHIETRFPEGALCYLDQRGPHRVENRDPALQRVHLVVDVESDSQLRALIAADVQS